MDSLYVGIDVGKKFCQIFAFSEAGEVFEERIGTLDADAWPKVFGTWTRTFSLRACFEAGPHYEWMYDLLKPFCQEVVMIDPAQFGIISKSQKKTDKNDARKLAEGLRRGDLPVVYVPPQPSRANRRLVSFVHWHSRQMAGVKIRIRGLLMTYRLECPHSDVLSARAAQWFATAQLDEQGRLFLEMLLEQARLLETQRKKLDAQLPGRLAQYGDVAKRLDGIPGFGPLVTLAVLSAIVDVGRFRQAKDLCGYFGTCGRVFQSGQTLRLGNLTKRGNKTVRWLLSQALRVLHRKDAKARKRYERLKRRKKRGVARAAQVNWLVRIVFYMLKNKEDYRLGGGKAA